MEGFFRICMLLFLATPSVYAVNKPVQTSLLGHLQSHNRLKRQVDCGTTEFFSSTGLVISPGFPSNYPNDIQCTYRIDAGVGLSTLHLNFKTLDIEYQDDCSWDALDIDGNLICGTTADNMNITVIDVSGVFEFTFSTDDSDTRPGFEIEYVLVRGPCGVTVFTGMSGVITSPSYPANYPADLNCNYTIGIDGQSMTLRLEFTMIDIEFDPACDFDALTIDRELFCGTSADNPDNITLSGLSADFQFTFHSDVSDSGSGFEIRYYLTAAESGPCGVTMFTDDSGAITSPGYPGMYPNDTNCVYTIVIDDGPRILELLFTMIDIEEDGSACSFDALTINGSMLCGTSADNIILPDLSDNFQFSFHSDESYTGNGFEIRYYLRAASTGPCGVTLFSGDSGIITSPGYPATYPNDINCTYIIAIGDEPMTLKLMFTMLDIEDDEDCFYDALTINGTLICGTSAPNITLPDLSDDFHFTFHSDVLDTGNGFKIRYYLTAAEGGPCGVTVFTDDFGVITSPGYPSTYPNDVNCTYTIVIDDGPRTLELMFTMIDLEEDDDCFDMLTINGANICGTSAANITLYELIDDFQFTFTSDSTIVGTGFELRYYLREASDEVCGYTMYTEESGVISSPDYPEDYPSDTSCTYTIRIGSEPRTLELTFLHLDIEQEEDCDYDYLEIGNVTICGASAESITLRGEIGDFLIHFNSDESHEGEGFQIRYEIKEEDPCGDTEFSEPFGTISSPGYPQNYPPNLNCTYTIVIDYDDEPMNLHLHFHDGLDIEVESDCSFDALTIDNVTLCGDKNVSTMTFRRLTDDFTFTFTSDKDVSGVGFLIHYNITEDPCGRRTEFSERAGIITSPGYPEDYPNYLHCRYTIEIGDKPMVVKLSFVSLDVESGSDYCMYDAVRVKDRLICGKEAETIFEYESGDFHIDFNSDGTNSGKGFQIVYTLTTKDYDIFVRETDCDINRKCDEFCPTGYSSDSERGYECPECACLPSLRIVPICGDRIDCPCAYWRDFQGCPICECHGNMSSTAMDKVPKENTLCGMHFGPDMTWMRIASPDFGKMREYPVDSNCSITIDTGSMMNSSILQLNFTYMDVEFGEEQCVDFIMFSHIYVCGRHERIYTINDVMGNYTIEFHSDSYAAGNLGFILDITVIKDPCPCRHELWCPCAEGSFQSLMDISMNRLRAAADTISDVFSYAVAHINRAPDAQKLKSLISDLFENRPAPKMKRPPKATTAKVVKTKPTKAPKVTTPKVVKTKAPKVTTPKVTKKPKP